jgi:hypothetical protein
MSELANLDKPVITEEQLRESFNLMLDDTYEPYELAGVSLLPSIVLENCDPTAYRVGLSEHADWLLEEGGIRTEHYTD